MCLPRSVPGCGCASLRWAGRIRGSGRDPLLDVALSETLRWTAVIALVGWCAVSPASVAAQALRPLDHSEPITYFIAAGSPASASAERDRLLVEWALEAWSGQVTPALEIVPGPEATATIRIYWVSTDTGLYGEMRARAANGKPAADIFVSTDTDGLGPDIALRAQTDPLFRDTIVYLTCVHELGHAFGLAHTRAFPDIMYSFQYGGDIVDYFMRFRRGLAVVEDVRTTSPFSPADREVFRSLYAGPSGP